MNWKPSNEALELLETMIEYPDDYNLTEYEEETIQELYKALKKL